MNPDKYLSPENGTTKQERDENKKEKRKDASPRQHCHTNRCFSALLVWSSAWRLIVTDTRLGDNRELY